METEFDFEKVLENAKNNDADAQNELGNKYYDDGDYNTAVEWYRKAAEQGHAEAQLYLGYSYGNGQAVKQDQEEAAKWYRKAAEQGDAGAQINLGFCYENGQGVRQDPAEAAKWYRKAAEQGDEEAQYNMGVCYGNGLGVRQDPTEAVKWYRKAAEQGYGGAQYNLGAYYYDGLGVNQDYTEAVKWYKKAVAQGHADAQYNLGVCYDNGQGVKQNHAEAANLYRKAAEQGHADAQFNLGVCYHSGQGVKRDYTEALKWYRKAEEQGHVKAQYNLGVCYDNGEGVKQDDAEAIKWYRKAAEQGDAKAQKLVDRYEKKDRISFLDFLFGTGTVNNDEEPQTPEKPERPEKQTEPSPVDVRDLMNDINSMIGLSDVKKDINGIINLIKIQNLRKTQNFNVPAMSYHLVFTGNPGTGKTTVARKLAKIYKSLGLIEKGHLVEVDRSDLVAGYVGQTAIKTREVINKSLGGVLFIDEAYSLAGNSDEDFGKEAIDTLLKSMEDKREKFIVIVAGYTKPMERFINSNPGLRSRFNKYIEFPDYSPEELMKIFTKMCHESGYELSSEAADKLSDIINNKCMNKTENFANAREVRNIFESVLIHNANRLANIPDLNIRQINTIEAEDIDCLV